MVNRFDCLFYIARHFPEWPKPSDTGHTKASHCGYSWTLDGVWFLENDDDDVITESDWSEFIQNEMNYTRESLKKAVIDSMPNGDKVLGSMTLPDCLSEACVSLFLKGDLDSDHAQLIRRATRHLQQHGKLLCCN